MYIIILFRSNCKLPELSAFSINIIYISEQKYKFVKLLFKKNNLNVFLFPSCQLYVYKLPERAAYILSRQFFFPDLHHRGTLISA